MNAITLTATLLLGLLYASVGIAAHNTYVFFDWQNCRVHTAQNDSLTGNEVYAEWRGKAKQLSDAETLSANWAAFHINDGESIGICRLAHSGKSASELRCHKDSYNRFPLAGATFRFTKTMQSSEATLQCVSGCKVGVPRVVYDEGYEPEDTDPNVIALEKAFRRYEKKCPAK